MAISDFFKVFFTRARVKEAAGATAEEEGWRRVGADKGRDLSPMTQSRMQKLAAHLWESNNIANRLIELKTVFLLGEGVSLQVDDPEAQGWLDKFWMDPINRMDLNLEKHVRELGLFGEQLWPVFVNELTGHVRLGKIDPSQIETVICDPDNAAVPIGVRVTRPEGKKKLLRVIYNGDDYDLFGIGACKMREAMTDGECFFWRVNDLSNGRRGRSDILSSLDMADAYEELVFGEIDGAVQKRSVVWDVLLKNATQEEVEERAKTIEPPGPNSVRVHNDAEEWNVLTPDLKAADADGIARIARNHILSGSTVPEHWFGGGGDVNLATASSMGEPTYKVFAQRQRFLKAILEEVAKFVIRKRLEAIGLLGLENDDALQPTAVFPELTAKDIAKYAAAFQQVVVSVTQAVAAGVMSEDTAVRLVALTASLLGLEIDPVEELKAAQAEAAKRREREAFSLPPLPPMEPLPAQTPPVQDEPQVKGDE